MREIKFRGMGEDGKWYYGNYLKTKQKAAQPTYQIREIEAPFRTIFINPKSVEQYTGLKIEGLEIYK